MQNLENSLSALQAFDHFERAIQYAKENSPFYAEKLSFLKDKELAKKSIDKIPFTTKEDLSQRNSDFLCVPLNKIADFVTTSGTSGEPVTIYLTKKDLQRLAENEHTALGTTGADENDIFQLMTTIDRQFMAGLAYFLGVQHMNAGMIRIGPGVPELQWKSILQNKPTVLIAVPSFILALLDFAKKNGIAYETSSIRSIVCIGEPIRNVDFTLNVLGKRIIDQWNVQIYSTYASTEMAAAFTECEAQKGCHLNENLLYLEVLNEDNIQVENGQIGEIVITSIGTEGTPLVRYKTGDLAHIYTDKCECGRKSPRLGPIIGRKNQMIKFKGTTLFPNSIYSIFDDSPEITIYKIEVSKDYLGHDSITVLLEKQVENSIMISQLVSKCQSQLRVVPHFVFLETDYLRSQVFKKNSRKPEKIVFK